MAPIVDSQSHRPGCGNDFFEEIMKHSVFAIMVAFVLVSAPALAQQQPQDHSAHGYAAVAAQKGAATEGEVRKVDKEAKKITLKHGPITNLEMPAMTMVFQVADPAMFDRVKPGDKVRFVADKVNGTITLTSIEPAS